MKLFMKVLTSVQILLLCIIYANACDSKSGANCCCAFSSCEASICEDCYSYDDCGCNYSCTGHEEECCTGGTTCQSDGTCSGGSPSPSPGPAPGPSPGPSPAEKCIKGPGGTACLNGGSASGMQPNCTCDCSGTGFTGSNCQTPGGGPVCPSGENDCTSTEGCGWCISSGWDGECKAGDMAGPFGNNVDCQRAWYPGRYRTATSMCVSVVSDDDVRCYQQCQYGQGIETFIVPDQQTCDSYDSAINKIQVPFSLRKEVLQHVNGIIVNNATHIAHIRLMQMRTERDIMLSKLNETSRARALQTLMPLDMTRQLIGEGVQDMEDKGLGYLEDTACGIFTGPAAPFCAWAFNSPMGQYVNKEIENIPLIKHTANWIANTANEYVPSGARNVIDDVADAYNTATNFENQCKSAANAITGGLFGWL